MENNRAELIFEGGPDNYEDLEEIQMEDLKEAPIKFEDTKPEVTDPLEEINLGSLEEPKVTYVSSLLQGDLKEQIIHTLKEFKDCFAWSYKEMPGLKRDLVEHRLLIKPEFKPHRQLPRRMSKEVELKVKEEIEKLVKAKFIRLTRYAQWLANIIPIVKKNGKLCVCIDFREDRKSTRLNSSHSGESRMPSSA